MAIGSLLDKAKAIAADAATGVKGKVVETTKNALVEIQELEPVLRGCGLVVGDLMVTMSIPPGVTVVIEQKAASKECLAELVTKDGEFSKLQAAIVRGLKEAYSLEGTVNQYGMTIGEVEMELTFPPKVHVHLKPLQANALAGAETGCLLCSPQEISSLVGIDESRLQD